ncbi:MAG: hypothetical protein JW929_09410 [Anaerolineales bacterium]|nr:hypothetical protein [Anaerolineales bacterium]
MAVDERLWKIMQKRLGYSDGELAEFRKDPRNEDVLSKADVLAKKYIILEAVDARGCNSRHKTGDRIYFDGAGNLLSELSPKRICVYALSNALLLIYAANEMIYAGVDPNEMRFKRTGCVDVGLRCGGWGHVVWELRVEDRP